MVLDHDRKTSTVSRDYGWATNVHAQPPERPSQLSHIANQYRDISIRGILRPFLFASTFQSGITGGSGLMVGFRWMYHINSRLHVCPRVPLLFLYGVNTFALQFAFFSQSAAFNSILHHGGICRILQWVDVYTLLVAPFRNSVWIRSNDMLRRNTLHFVLLFPLAPISKIWYSINSRHLQMSEICFT